MRCKSVRSRGNYSLNRNAHSWHGIVVELGWLACSETDSHKFIILCDCLHSSNMYPFRMHTQFFSTTSCVQTNITNATTSELFSSGICYIYVYMYVFGRDATEQVPCHTANAGIKYLIATKPSGRRVCVCSFAFCYQINTSVDVYLCMQ